MRCALETEWQQVEQVRIVSKALPTTKKAFRNNPKEKCQATNKETTCKDRNTQDSRRRNKIIESNASSYFTGLRVGERVVQMGKEKALRAYIPCLWRKR